MIDDTSLLRRFVEQRTENAFAELVRQHLNLVYFSALRQTNGDTHRAEDAAQATFVLLAQKADSLCKHPNLVGWLHTSACNQGRELMRAEQRRYNREQAANTMHEITSSDANDEAWTRVRPIIDDALQDLAPDDREAVLLRYFENRSFAEIGDTLRLGENGARMRVTRALEKLEPALARRGVKSTASALATVLTIPAAMAAPANLASTISTTVFSAASIGSTGAATFTIIKLMTSTKLVAIATGIALLAASGTALYQHNQLQSSRAELTALHQQQSDLQTQIDNLTNQLTAAKKRTDEADADSGKLLAAMAATQSEPLKTPTKPVPITHALVEARYKHGQALVKSGQFEEALKELLWCYDTGMPQVMGFAGVRSSFLLGDLARLGKTYPPALAALQERRDSSEQRFRESVTDTDALNEYANLNRALDDNQKTLALFDSIPPDDSRRTALAYNVKDLLLNAQRYTELAKATPYFSIAMSFDATTDTGFLAKLPADQATQLKQNVAGNTGKDIEMLAGAGDIAHASQLIDKVLAFDRSAETIAILQSHLARAGHPELLKSP
jgi:RNA polymerase sigma factor (sigma-70 family)